MIKRIVVIAAFAMLAVVAVAAAATKDYSGKVDAKGCGSSCTVEFEATIKHGDATKVGQFGYTNIPTKCDQGLDHHETHTGPSYQPPPFKVDSKRRFHGSAVIYDGSTKWTMHGRFAKDFKSAKGTLRVHGGGSGGKNFDCDTGTVDWSAKR